MSVLKRLEENRRWVPVARNYVSQRRANERASEEESQWVNKATKYKLVQLAVFQHD